MNPESPREIDPLLVLRAQLGDREAWEELMRVLGLRLAPYLRSIVGAQEAEDVLQDVLLIIYRKIKWLAEPAYVLTWSYRIAGREAFRRMRRIHGSAIAQLTDEEWAAIRARPVSADQNVLGQEAVRTLGELPPAARAVLGLHYLEGMSIDEAAEWLDISRARPGHDSPSACRACGSASALLEPPGRRDETQPRGEDSDLWAGDAGSHGHRHLRISNPSEEMIKEAFMDTIGTHQRVMQEIERTEQRYRLAFFGAVLLEGALLAALLLLTNLKDRTHVLLLLGFVGSYSIIVLALLALGAHVSRVGQRILRALAQSGQ